MLGTKTDKRNIEFIKLIAQLRDHIDLHRIIGLNADPLPNSDINDFLGYLQKSAQEALAIYFCKIFESSTRNELNSIPGIIDSLSPTPLSVEQRYGKMSQLCLARRPNKTMEPTPFAAEPLRVPSPRKERAARRGSSLNR